MKRLSRLSWFFTLLIPTLSFADLPTGLYINSYGNSNSPALIFVHGGPGYDSQDFESTTAARLAAEGFFVIVYDQRGQGRSAAALDVKDYTYQSYANDLHAIIQLFKLVKPTLLAHSHGGPISLKFDQAYPNMVAKIILMGAPLDLWKLMDNIRVNCTERYSKSANTEKLRELEKVFTMLNSPKSVEEEIKAVGEVFILGAERACALYQTEKPTNDARKLKAIAKNRQTVVDENRFYPMPSFLTNENYIHLNHTPWVRDHADHIFGIYGDEDGLFTRETLRELENAFSKNPHPNRFQILHGASHGMYIDQQDAFIVALKKVIR